MRKRLQTNSKQWPTYLKTPQAIVLSLVFLRGGSSKRRKVIELVFNVLHQLVKIWANFNSILIQETEEPFVQRKSQNSKENQQMFLK